MRRRTFYAVYCHHLPVEHKRYANKMAAFRRAAQLLQETGHPHYIMTSLGRFGPEGYTPW